jgi:hypothetical protein
MLNLSWNYKIKPILLDDIIEHDKKKYNSNNHWVNNTRPCDYEYVLEQTSTSKWINQFKNYKKITIDNPVWIKWLKEASEISAQTGKFTELFSDEFDLMVEMLEKEFGYQFDNIEPGYFVRVNNVSLKYGQHKEGPYKNIRTILESVVSSIGSHSPIKYNTLKLEIYLIKWIQIDPEFEFRVFVFNNKITAISQQNLYSQLFKNYFSDPIDPVDHDDSDNSDNSDNYSDHHNSNNPDNFTNIIKDKLNIVVNYYYQEILPKINWISNYTFDFAIVESKPYFIELNSFGKEYAAGSALFHWILDEKILYNDFSDGKLTIEFRYTIANK